MITLRALDERDLDVVAALEQRCHPYPWPRAQFVDEFGNGDAVVVGAVDEFAAGAVLVGYVVVRRILDELWILNIATDPERRRQGIGDLLMVRALETAQATSTPLWLEVREHNAAARRLYEKHGLTVAGRRPGYYRAIPPSTTREAAVLMVRRF